MTVTYDQARFTLDADIRRCWVRKGSNSIVYRNGSKKALNIGGAYVTGEFYAYVMTRQVKEEVLWNIKLLRMKFPKMLLILDKAPWHKKSKKVQRYLKKHRRELKIIWFPTGCPEMNPVEESWRQAKEEVNGGKIHKSFEVMKKELRYFLKYTDFKQDMGKYLRP